MYLVLRERERGDTYRLKLPHDPRAWGPGSTQVVRSELTLPSDIPAGSYELLLHLSDPASSLAAMPQFSIQLANEGVWEEATGYNRLLHVVAVG